MMKSFVLGLICLCMGPLAFGQGNIMFEQANQLYHAKDFDSAINLYSQLINEGYCSSDLYYNAGNAYYKKGDAGMAVWCFRKSLKICNDKNTRDNYLLARAMIEEPLIHKDEIFFVRWWRMFYGLLTVNGWSVLSLISFVTAMLIMILLKLEKINIALRRFALLFFFISFVSFVMMFISYYYDSNHYEAVIVKDSEFRKDYQRIFKDAEAETISKGEEIRRVSHHPVTGWVKVRLPDGREGWVQRSTIRRL